MLSPTSSPSVVDDVSPPSLFDANPLRFMLHCNRHGAVAQQQTAAAVGAGTAGGTSPATAVSAPSSSSASPAAAGAASAVSLRLRIPSTETRIEADSKKPYTVFLIQIIACCSSFSQETHHARTRTEARKRGGRPRAESGERRAETSTRNVTEARVKAKRGEPGSHRRCNLSLCFLFAADAGCSGVLRRYSDFLDLHRDLCAEFGITSGTASSTLSKLAALLPSKRFIGSSLEADFVATRRAALENYMARMMAEPGFAGSRSVGAFLTATKEAAAVSVQLAAAGTISISATRSNSAASGVSDGAASALASLSAQLASLESKVNWLQDSSGASHKVLHEQRMLATELASLKKKIGVLELAQPYLQQINNANRHASGMPLAAPPSNGGGAMNGNARPFQSQHRSVSGPVGAIRYDAFEYGGAEDGDEEDEEGDILPRRSISQQNAAIRAAAAWPPAHSNQLQHQQLQHSALLSPQEAGETDADERDRGRSLSESHVTDRAISFLSLQRNRATKAAALRGGGAPHNSSTDALASAISPTSVGNDSGVAVAAAITPRTVLDNSSRSLSSIDPWHSHRFQLRHRTESYSHASAVRLTQRQHSDPLAANPNSASALYKEWVGELGIEVAATNGSTGAHTPNPNQNQSGSAQQQQQQQQQQQSAEEHRGANGNKSVSADASDKPKCAALFAAFPFINKVKKPQQQSGTVGGGSASVAAESKTSSPSLFSVPMAAHPGPISISLPPSAHQNAPANSGGGGSNTPGSQTPNRSTSPGPNLPPPSAAITLKVVPGAHKRGSSGPPRRGNSTANSSLGTSPELPQSPELGGSPNLGDSPELRALAAASGPAHSRTTLSPRAYGISPVNLSAMFPAPSLRKSASTADDEDDAGDDRSFALTFSKERVQGPREARAAAARADSASSASSAGSKPEGSLLNPPSALTLAVQPAANQQSLSSPSPIPPEDLLLDCDPTQSLYRCCTDSVLNARMNDLLAFISPTAYSESRYLAVLQFIEKLIKHVVGAEVFCHGSFALKTYLPDADLDISCFFSKNNEDTWVQRLVGALCQEAAIPSQGSSPQFAVKSVTFVNGIVQVVKCQIGSIPVDISGNQTGALATLALFEEVDKLIGRDHLFKRTILLIKAWAQQEATIVDSGNGLLSSYCLRSFVLFIFNAYHLHIHTPLQGLFLFLAYFGRFDFQAHAVGLFGPISLEALPKFEVVSEGACAWPADGVPLISRELLQTYSLVATATGTTGQGATGAVGTPLGQQGGGAGGKHGKPAPDTLPRYFINCTDPCNPFNNLGRSVHATRFLFVREAFVQGSKTMRKIMTEWAAHQAAQAELRRNLPDPPSTEDLAQLDDADALEAYRLVSKLFQKTLVAYGNSFSGGGRTRFVAPSRKGALRAGGRSSLMTLSEASGASSRIASGSATPVQFSSSPQLRPSVPPIVSDSDSEHPALEDQMQMQRMQQQQHHHLLPHQHQQQMAQHLLPPHQQQQQYGLAQQHHAQQQQHLHPQHHSHLPHASSSVSPPSVLPGQQASSSISPPGLALPGLNAAAAPTTPLDANLNRILDNLSQARQFEVPDVSETDLVTMIRKLLLQYGSVPVGKLGSLLHNVMNNHSLPSMLKERSDRETAARWLPCPVDACRA